MSSSYYALCVSHDPALEVASGSDGWEWKRPEQALNAIANGSSVLAGHRTCDLVVVGNYFNTYYCPPNPKCGHTEPVTLDEPWIGLMKAAMRSSDDAVRAQLDRFTGCWTAERMRRIDGWFGKEEP